MIDAHSHIDLFDKMNTFFNSEKGVDIGVFAVGTTPKAYLKEKSMLKNFSNICVGLGFHPQLSGSGYDDIILFEKLIKHTRYIGEIGLDFSNSYLESKSLQLNQFNKVIQLCEKEGNKVISVHSLKAASTVIDVIAEYSQRKSNKYIMHWFTGSIPQVRRAVELGCFFSINQRMANTKSGREIICAIPNNKILLETDAPFGSKYVSYSSLRQNLQSLQKNISEIKGVDMASVISKNERAVFENLI